jgi:hypothetical protein
MQQVLGCSVSYRIAIGPQQGRKVFTLQTIPAWEEDDRFAQVAKVAGFSLHAGVAGEAWERSKLERLCRYITRPAVSEKRLSVTPSGNIRYDVNGITNAAGAGMRKSGQLKTPYNDGTTHVIFEPLDFMSHIPVLHPSGDFCRANWLSCQFVIAKLAALVPKPRVNLTRFHGVLFRASCPPPFGPAEAVQNRS